MLTPDFELTLFATVFNPYEPKKLKGKLEYRVRGDLDTAKAEAAHLIKHFRLNLEVVCIGSMSTMKAFFVQPINNN